MKKTQIIFITLALFIWTACDTSKSTSSTSEPNSSWIFVANEGKYGASNGSISMIDDFGNVQTVADVGDVVQSLEVYGDKLIVLINNSHKIQIYNITRDGLSLPGIAVSTDNSSPREMVIVNDKVYFTNWTTSDVKVLNLFNYVIESSIPVGLMPEGITTDGTTLWVANSGEDTVNEIDINSLTIIEHSVGKGPQNLTLHNNEVFVSRTYYDEEWNAFHGATKISEEVLINNYGGGGACGGSIMEYNDDIYRSFDGGLARMVDNLDLDLTNKIGNYDQSQVYHVEIINGNIWFTLTDHSTMNMAKIVDSNGNELTSYDVGVSPGDFAFWKKSE